MPGINMRQIMRRQSQVFLKLFTRTTVNGLNNIPNHGPLLILANHVSTIDSMLLLAHLPDTVEFVGPGDFKLLFPGNLIIKWYGLIPVKRSLQLDLSSLKAITEILKSGKMLGLFPQGGTWEKSIHDAKPGAAYLSMMTGSPMLPVGIGGAYRSWDKVVRLQRPRLTVNIGKVMPPVEAPREKSKRTEVLETAAYEMMQHVYELLPPEDQGWYDDLAAKKYALSVAVTRSGKNEMLNLPGGHVLAELLLKPNLLSPLVHNARLPLNPLRRKDVHFSPDQVRHAAESLHTALHNQFEGYIEYRLGEEKSKQLYTALNALVALTHESGMAQMSLLTRSYLPD
jgi:1-acyl-sn-glycerol-3-phosphate acyltransferase